MRRVALVAYHFPPLGGAGVQRAAKLARYLPDFGWEVVVATGSGPVVNRWTPIDASLGAEAAAATLSRVPGPEPGAASMWRGRAERWLGAPSAWSTWWAGGVAAALRELGPFDAILATMSPFESAAAVGAAASELGVPWVADLRDPWALDEMTAYPTLIHRRREIGHMRRALAGASAIVMNTPEAARQVRTRLPTLAGQVVEPIPNGFDPEDFMVEVKPRDDPAFRIVHTGYLHTALGGRGAVRAALGGRDERGVDRGARSHVHLLAALRMIAVAAELRPVELHLAGVLSPADRAAVPPGVTVREHGYLAHAASIRLARSADLLFLPMHDLPRGRRATIVPGKTYEYLASERPILAAVPDGDARDLLEAAPGVYTCSPRDADAMARIVRDAAARPRAADIDRSATMRPFERRRLAERMAAVLDGAVEGASGVQQPRAPRIPAGAP